MCIDTCVFFYNIDIKIMSYVFSTASTSYMLNISHELSHFFLKITHQHRSYYLSFLQIGSTEKLRNLTKVIVVKIRINQKTTYIHDVYTQYNTYECIYTYIYVHLHTHTHIYTYSFSIEKATFN